MIELLVESWIWYAVVLLVAASRFVSRRMTLGSFRKFQADDYVMVVALCFYTAFIPCINIVRDHNSNLLPENFDWTVLPPEDVRSRVYGSKMILVIEQCQCVVVWLAKVCLLTLYFRLTTYHKENIAIRILLGYVIVTFIVMDALYFGVWCQPFSNYWALPVLNKQCNAATNHLITNAVFNLTSDVAMLVVGLPMFLRLNLPLRKKVSVVGVFSLGIFTVVAAILNKVYSFSEPFGGQWTFWYVRESSTALLVANLPFVWAFWRKLAGFETSLQGVSRQASGATAGGGGTAMVESRRRSSAKRRLSSWFRRSTNAEMELQSPRTMEEDRQKLQDEEPEMSASDFFAMDAPRQGSADADPNPITHPHLFYARQRAATRDSGGSPFEPAVLSQSPERESTRRDSPSQMTNEITPPPSSAFPSLTSSITHKSTEGFV